MEYKIKHETLTRIATYLVERPYKEVNYLLDELNSVEVIKQNPPEVGESTERVKDVEVKDAEEVKPKRKRGK